MFLLLACAPTSTPDIKSPEDSGVPCTPTVWYTDADADGYGDPTAAVEACDPVTGAVAEGGDCDDVRPDVHPGGREVCEDGLDADCDGVDPACGGFEGEYSASDADVRVTGAASDDLGRIVRVADVDGDGQDDVVAATFLAAGRTGGAVVFPGPLTSGSVDLGWRVEGERPGMGPGRSLSLGDLDGDGTADLGLGAPYDSGRNGLYVVYGPVTGDVSLADAVLLAGSGRSYAGHGADIHGDVTGDGVNDAVVGAYYTGSPSGTVYVEFGPITADVDLATEADATLTGEPGNVYAGRIVEAGADLDGDGVGDLIIACLGDLGPPGSGGFYVVYGPVTDQSLADADGRYAGVAASDTAGLWLGAGDVDGDGRADVLASAYDNTLATTAGAAYVVYGPAADDEDLSAADVIVRGDTAGQYGGGVAAGDVDGDGVDELLFGAQATRRWASTPGPCSCSMHRRPEATCSPTGSPRSTPKVRATTSGPA